MIRVKDLKVGDCFVADTTDYLVQSVIPLPTHKEIGFLFKNLKTGRSKIHCIYEEDEEMITWQFIARQVPLSPNVEIELAAVRGEMQKQEKKEKRGWEPDIVEPFFNIRDTLG